MKNKILFLCLLSIGLQSCQNTKQESTSTIDKVQSNSEEASTNCKNCGMPSTEFPKWNVKVLRGNASHYFCSPRCMLLQATANPSGIQSTDSILVVDYYEQKFIAAKTAFFVIDSDITGPMGHDFVPFLDEKSAKDFQTEHKGKKIVRMAEVNQEMILNLGK
jgi:nitrous oxide reductase accessory protein NosL